MQDQTLRQTRAWVKVIGVVAAVAMRALTGAVAEDSFQQIATGLAVWPKLHYTIP